MSGAHHSSDSTEPIAIIGLSALMPKAASLAEFWANILDGTDCIEDVPASRWDAASHFSDDRRARDKTYCRRGGFLPDVPFDPLEYGLQPNALAVTDASQLLSLAVAKAAFADAGYPVLSGVDHGRTAAILGVAGTSMKLLNALSARLDSPTWERALNEAGVDAPAAQRAVARMLDTYPEWDENAFPGFLASLVPGRISNRFDLGAASYAVDAACASSLCALRLACAELAGGYCDLALTGGVDTDNSITAFMSFSKTPALSQTQQVRPFDAACDGTLISEGVGMLVLKRLADATAAGDRVYAVIRGIGVSTDGRGRAIYVPRADGQVRAIHDALRQAGFGPETVGLIEAHGTGTPVGDAAELDGLMETYGARSAASAPIALGSIKSQIGHTKAAAGAASMIKAALALHHKVLPPTLGVTKPHPTIAKEDSPFTLPRAARPWFSPDRAPRRAAVSAFGFGGANYHVVIEEPGVGNVLPQGAQGRVLVNGTKGSRTAAPAGNGKAALHAPGQLSPEPRRHDAATDPQPGASRHAGLVAVFSGQGSQYVGMGSRLAIEHPAFRSAVERMDRALMAAGEAPCSTAMFPPWPRTEREAASQRAGLQKTLFAQAAVGAFSMGAFALLRNAGLRPACAIGHSFGELTALWSAGCLADAQFADLVVARGRALSPPPSHDSGALLAVRAPRVRVEELLRADARLGVANLNGPEQIVIGGPVAAVDEAEDRFAAAGIEAIRLPVAAAFHTSCVDYAREPWCRALSAVRPHSPHIPVIGNSSAEPYPDQADGIVRILGDQPFRPVRFHDQVEAAYAAGGRIFLEIGPKALMARLIDEILDGRPHATIAINPDPAGDAEQQLARAFEHLNAVGVRLEPFPRLRPQAAAIAADRPSLPRGTIMLGACGPVRPAQPRIATLAAAAPQTVESTGAVHTTRPGPPAAGPAVPSSAPPPAGPDSQAETTTLQQVQEMQALLTESHGLFLAGQAAIARTLLESETIIDPAALALLRDVHESGASLHERYLQDQAEIAKAVLAGRSRASPPRMADVAPVSYAPAPKIQPRQAPEPQPQAVPAVRAMPPPETSADILGRLRAALAGATGYPIDFIDPAMDLEGDLGIDSVKRMEILSGFRADHPNVPARELGRARTLAAIASLLAGGTQAGEQSPPTAGASPADPAQRVEPPRLDPPEPAAAAQPKGPAVPARTDGTGAAPIAQAVLRPLPPLARDGAQPIDGAVILVLGDGPDLTAALVGEIERRGAVAITAAHLANGHLANGHAAAPTGHTLFEALDDAHIARALDRVERESGPIWAAIVLVPATGGAVSDDGFPVAGAFMRWLQLIAPRLHASANGRASGRLLAVTRLDGQLGFSGMGLSQCEAGGTHAAVRTAGWEWPHLLVQSVDAAPALSDRQAAAGLGAELTADDFATADVGLTPHGRNCIDLVRVNAPQGPRRRQALENDALILFSGGARGIGALCAAALARETRARMLVVGRTALSPADPDWARGAVGRALRASAIAYLRQAGSEPALRQIEALCRSVEAEREVRDAMAQLQACSPSVEYLAADVADGAALATKLAAATARLGPVTAIVHAAGVLADRRIEDVQAADVDLIFRPKIGGLRNLLNAVNRERLTRLALFSSTAACFGNEGQAVYAMANEVLNKYAFGLARELPAARVVALDWGPWHAGMVTDEIADRFLARGIALLPPAAGCAAFLDLFLDDTPGAYQFVIGDGPKNLAGPVESRAMTEASIRGIA
jgi:acyl transferase domain-containing protein/aryl carrier-like protein